MTEPPAFTEKPEKGIIQFWINPDIDLTKITDSMQIDSGTTLATCYKNGFYAYLKVVGGVKVFFNPIINEEPTLGDCYRAPSEFPQELKDLIAKNPHWFQDERLEIAENNWFELFWCQTPDDAHVSSECVDIEGDTQSEIMSLFMEFAEYAENIIQDEQKEWIKLKNTLLNLGSDALSDFIGKTIYDTYSKKEIESMLEDIYEQMPDELIHDFYVKYCQPQKGETTCPSSKKY